MTTPALLHELERLGFLIHEYGEEVPGWIALSFSYNRFLRYNTALALQILEKYPDGYATTKTRKTEVRRALEPAMEQPGKFYTARATTTF